MDGDTDRTFFVCLAVNFFAQPRIVAADPGNCGQKLLHAFALLAARRYLKNQDTILLPYVQLIYLKSLQNFDYLLLMFLKRNHKEEWRGCTITAVFTATRLRWRMTCKAACSTLNVYEFMVPSIGISPSCFTFWMSRPVENSRDNKKMKTDEK